MGIKITSRRRVILSTIKYCCSFIKHYFCLYFQGVLTQETDRNVTIFGRQYVAASYVKFIESAGGRMVPILYPFSNIIFCNFILYLLYIVNIIFATKYLYHHHHLKL